ncbi:MAG: NAD-dependent epimerase/dehydratase family protein [Candidatus Kapabacteria bacterium]|nr:NAD-dependent epimerase/dehydratase family protein [Ignavibacteriota bacterium]MCW5886012.1 NAD-dependent epimerase/dehydratase family protein [Candidatus Kapabacteria bacterium]
MKTALITGINGFIGSNLAERLLKEGWKVRGLIRKSSDLKFLEGMDIEYYYGDITEPSTLTEPMNGIDKVFHVAALSSDWGHFEKFYRINVEGTVNVAKAAHLAGVERMIYISTVAMYGFGRLNVKESDEKLHTDFPYCETKKIAEEKVFEFARQSGLRLTAVKPGNVFGVKDHTFIEKYLDALIAGKAGYIDGGLRKTCPVYVENLIDGILLASEKEEAIGETFFITDGLDINWKDFTDKFSDELGIPRTKSSFPYFLAYAVATVMEFIYTALDTKEPPLLTRYRIFNGGKDYTFSIEKAKNILGYYPKVDFDEAVKRAVNWYKNR